MNNKDKTATYTGAGDLPLIYKNSENGSVTGVQSKGMLLGFSLDGEYEDTVINVNCGDNLLITTDGIIETRNPQQEQFGTERLMNLLKIHNNGFDELEQIKNSFTDFSGGNFEDDISLISIKVK